MGHPAIRRLFIQLAVACLALASVPAQGAAARSASDARPDGSEAALQKQPAADEVAYQKLIDAANAVVGIKVKALANARSNETLGRERLGSGVLIEKDGLVLTIGYLILEAEEIEVTDAAGKAIPASVVAYDHATGFGLVRPVSRLPQKPIAFGTARPVAQLDRLMIATGGGEQNVSIATVVSKRRFAGYWEYLIDNAIFTSPPRLDHSGAALINKEGELVGIGSLFVMDALSPGERLPGNMFVPIDLIKPILNELAATGAQKEAKRPWLGVNSLEEDGRVKVMQVNDESPAAEAGIEAGDIILAIDGEPVESLEKFYRALWRSGPAGVEVKLRVLHGPTLRDVTVRTIDRREFLRKKPTV